MSNITTRNIVLYADDDHDDLDLVRDSFQRYTNNVELVTVTDGTQAVSYLKSLNADMPSPCLVILDINMPFMSGKEALMQIREMDRFKNIPVIIFTTSAMPIDRNFAKRYGAGFITKPLDVKQMEVITDEFIDHCADEIKKNIRKHLT